MPKSLPQRPVEAVFTNYLQYCRQVHIVTHIVVAQAGAGLAHESLSGVQESVATRDGSKLLVYKQLPSAAV